jgi:erythromycin esterase-like protein
LSGIDESLPDNDLLPVDKLVASAKHVALGESIHSSGGFIKIKLRIIKYLVERHGFRTLGLELNREDADIIESFIRDGNGTALSAAKRFGIWASTESVLLLQWLRGFNEAHPTERFSVFGFDVQQPRTDYNRLADFLRQSAPTDADRLLNGLLTSNLSAAQPFPEEEYLRCLQGLKTLDGFFSTLSTPVGVEIQINFLALSSWQDEWFYYRSDIKKSTNARDEGMAKIFQLTIKNSYSPSVKNILWAHNWHIATHTDEMPYYRSATSLGSHLRSTFGNSFVSLGVFGYEVGIDWPRVGCGIRPVSTEKDSMELILNHMGPSTLFVDLRVPHPVFIPDMDYSSYMSGSMQMKPGRQFEGLVFLKRSEKMNPLSWQSCM